MVTYYRNVLGEKGNLVFEVPPTYMFEMGRFREETMAFPPGVTVKDYTFSGSAGYPNPDNGGTPERFPTIIQIVPPPSTRARPNRRRSAARPHFGRTGLIMMCAPAVPGSMSHGRPGAGLMANPVVSPVA